jgi:hypothetical protein
MAPSFDPDEAGKKADELIAAGKTSSDDIAPDDIDVDGLDESDEDAPGDKGKEENFKHKYEVLQGKYNTEIPRLQAELSAALIEKERLANRGVDDPIKKAVDTKVDELEEEIKGLQEEYPNLFKGFDALITKRVNESLRPLQSTVDTVVESSARSEHQKYLDSLDRDMPAWRDINKSPEFKEWLNIKDRYSGVERLGLLSNAYRAFNVTLTKAFFEDFANEKGIKLEGNSAPNVEVHARKREDSFDITPSGAPSNAAPKGNKTGGVTREDIQTLYKDRATGRFVGTEEDFLKAEAKIFKAMQEGRVRN